MRVLIQALGFALLVAAWLPMTVMSARQPVIYEKATGFRSESQARRSYIIPEPSQSGAAHQLRLSRVFVPSAHDLSTTDTTVHGLEDALSARTGAPRTSPAIFCPLCAGTGASLPRAPCRA